MKLIVILAMMIFAAANVLAGETQPDSQLSSRVSLSGGMGVAYISAPRVVEYVNALVGAYTTQRVPEFKSAVQFFGAFTCPLLSDWSLKAEYVYLLGSYNPDIPSRSSEFTLTMNMPSIILQYVLADEGLYNIKVGAGLGFHIASLKTTFLNLDDHLSANGLGTVIELEANTAFGDHVFAYLGSDLRWEFIGQFKNNAPGVQAAQPTVVRLPTGTAFSIGARLGFSYYF